MRPVKGIIFNLLEEVVTEAHGAATWDGLLDAAELDGAWTAIGSYPDAQLFALVGAASTALGIPGDDVVRWFGRSAMPLLYGRYAAVFDPHADARSFVLTLNDVIHPEVRKLFPGADVPDFDFDASTAGRLVMTYRSARAMCSLAEGLLQGAADHWQQDVVLEQTACLHRGDDHCDIVVDFVARP